MYGNFIRAIWEFEGATRQYSGGLIDTALQTSYMRRRKYEAHRAAASDVRAAMSELLLVAGNETMNRATAAVEALDGYSLTHGMSSPRNVVAHQQFIAAFAEFVTECQWELWYLPRWWQVWRSAWWKARWGAFKGWRMERKERRAERRRRKREGA
ncbi:hypothetical protein ACF1BR_32465 [Streptomyces rubiginosohelvolus]|uniref:hypothetical protein n=1 Tax=Streptomyces rubiginosohelvolus TaxID=67362 RepID=UPI0036FF1B8D